MMVHLPFNEQTKCHSGNATKLSVGRLAWGLEFNSFPGLDWGMNWGNHQKPTSITLIISHSLDFLIFL